jgi:PAS domain S-box-containing protein
MPVPRNYDKEEKEDVIFAATNVVFATLNCSAPAPAPGLAARMTSFETPKRAERPVPPAQPPSAETPFNTPTTLAPPRERPSREPAVLQSLRVRLPLIMSAFIALVLIAFLWVAFRQVESALLQAGGARAQGAADQVASILAQSAQQRLSDVERAARSTAVQAYLRNPADKALAAAAIQRLVTVATAGQPAIEVWDAAAHRVLSVPGPPAANGIPLPGLPAAGPPMTAGLSALQASHGVVFWEVVGESREGAAVDREGRSLPGRLMGHVFSRRLLTSASTADVIGRLVGKGAVVAFGNQTGGAWTDLSKIIASPPVDFTRPGVVEYQAPGGERRLGASAPIRGTPWAAWVEFPRDLVVAPARIFLTRMVIFGVCFVVVAAFLVRTLSARLTTPIRELTDAAEAIAAGAHVEPVDTKRRDEIGRLGAAFNTMATQVHGVQRELEARVEQRTRRLAESGALLERRLAELKETRQELDRFFAFSLDMLCIAGTDGYFKRLNPAWSETLGWTDEELCGRPYLDFVHPDDREDTIGRAGRLASGASVVAFENRYACRDGSHRWLQWKATSGDGGAIYASARDITGQKGRESHIRTLNDQLGQRVAELDALTQELEAFSYSVSHDLRAPLRHVTGFASLLQRSAAERLKETEARHLQTIVDAAARMGRLIDDLLAFSRMGRAAIAPQRVSLEALVRNAVQEVQESAPGRAIAWTIHPLPEVDGDPAMLQLVLVNLLSNAVKYTAGRARAEITVGASKSAPGETVVYVRDNGAGFDMQYVHKLFGVFQRLHSHDEFEGTGIGLANVRRIVHRHGGRVWAEGAVDAGANFFFSLPDTGDARP